ncbi:secretin N-terminal domain-containing protein [Paraburkholderia rhizosphaerae]|uniref:General secretion pathway protein D n=1 Tax=Paraburkholderia rhizosphaerae TaxID=480658 RepID=A0A4R8LKT0_9BURK|nr:secretin N-terminal domain-containing protein [Paraburkholderia rhizosphaerae]TDY43013.1 general secretion pathway protein D [Paraburkholderia rhizosphaerae]
MRTQFSTRKKLHVARGFALRNWRVLVLSVALPAVLAGCAAEKAYRDGEDLVARGKVDEGLAKLQEASTQEPRDAQYRETLLAVREHTVDHDDEQGDRLAASGAREAARQSYRHALTLEPANERALAGLVALENENRLDTLVERAQALAAKHDADGARRLIAQVLTEAPTHKRALALQRSLGADSGASRVEASLAAAYRKPIQIDFKDATLKQVFEVISRSAGLNFLFDKDVRTDQRTSIYLRNSTIEAAVRYVLATNQLAQQVLDENTVLVYPNTPAKLKDYQELAVRTFFLSNADAKTVATTLKTIVKSHDIVVDEKLNMVIVRDTPDAIKLAEKLVALEDVPEPEVMLEVEVIEVQRNATQNLGVAWPDSVTLTPLPVGSVISSASSAGSAIGGSFGNPFGSLGTTTGSTNGSSPSLSLNDLFHQTSHTVGVSSLSATVNANLTDSGAKLLTDPRIRVRNHEKAKILIGERVPNITSTATSTGFVSQSVNYIDIGLTLNVEPTIYLDDTVGIKVALEVSSLLQTLTGSSGTTAYEIGTRTASTVLQLKNGETDILAGLIDSQERTSGDKIPGFGQLPVLGRLFGATKDEDDNTEIVLAITPHLIRNIQRPDANSAYFTAGTESNMQSMVQSNGSSVVTTYSGGSTTSGSSSNRSSSSGSADASGASSGGGYGANGSNYPSGYGSGSSGVGGVAGVGSFAGSGVDPAVVGGAGLAAGTAQMTLQGPPQVKVGDSLTVALMMQADQPVTVVPATVTFDNTKLQFTGVTEGDFMKQSGAPTSFSSRVNNGQLILADSISGGTGAAAQGTFAVLNFRALAPASQSSIQVTPGSMIGVAGVPVTGVPPTTPYAVTVIAK